jgi:hypothetical protein
MLSTTVTLSPEALFQELGGEAVILDLASSTYFGLDAVGTRLWALLQQDPHVQRACAQLLEEFAVDAAQLERDVEDLLQQLAVAGLVQLEAPAR